MTAPVRMRNPSPCVSASIVRRAVQAARKSSQVLARPFLKTTCERSGSYKSKIDAVMNGSAAPSEAGCAGLPLRCVGRPSWVSTIAPIAYPHEGTAVAYISGLPGVIFDGWTTYGTICSGG